MGTHERRAAMGIAGLPVTMAGKRNSDQLRKWRAKAVEIRGAQPAASGSCRLASTKPNPPEPSGTVKSPTSP